MKIALTEVDDFEDEDDLKDVFNDNPLRYQPVYDAKGKYIPEVTDIFMGDEWLGRVGLGPEIHNDGRKRWQLNWVPGCEKAKLPDNWYRTMRDAAEALLRRYTHFKENPPTTTESLIEGDGEDEPLEDPAAEYPEFEFQNFGTSFNRQTVLVSVNGEFIGSLTHVQPQREGEQEWYVSFLPRRRVHTHLPVSHKVEGAMRLYDDFTQFTDLPIVPPAWKDLPDADVDPREYLESKEGKSKVRKLLSVISETDEDEDDAKDFDDDQLQKIVQAITDAGFKIELAERLPNGNFLIDFTWPIPDTAAYVNGWKRAREVLSPYVTLRQNDFTVEKYFTTDKNWNATDYAKARIIKRLEKDPGVWKIESYSGPNVHSEIYLVKFNEKIVGSVYLPSFGPPGDMVERLREELSELDEVAPFKPGEWGDDTGTTWATGPAMNWYRNNRQKLKDPLKNQYYLPKTVTGLE